MNIACTAIPTKQLELAIAQELDNKNKEEIAIAELLEKKKDEENVDRPTS